MASYDAAMHAGTTGHALADPAPTGHSTTEATGRLSAAIAGHGPAFARAKTLAEVKLATLTMITGDPVQAALTRQRRVLSDDHPDTLRSAHSLAAVLANLGEHDQAWRLDE
jgi:hypothetical protein